MSTSLIARTDRLRLKEPIIFTTREETQTLRVARRSPLILEAAAAVFSVESLNQLLANTIVLRDLYQEHPRQALGPNYYGVHRLFDKHFEEQTELADLLAERVETLGGRSIPRGSDVVEANRIPCVPKGREDTVTQITCLLQAHEVILVKAWAMLRDSAVAGNLEINDIIVSYVIRTNESQAWFLAEQMQ